MPLLVSGVVLAGGRATRFGADKLAADYRGQPLVHHAVHRLAEVCDDVIVVLAPGALGDGLPPGVRTVNDTTESEGPLAGLHTGLLAAVGSDLVVVAGGDMPDLQPPVLREMLRVLEEAQVDAVALAQDERARPLPCALRTWPAADLTHALLHAGRRRLRDLLDASRLAVIDEATWTALDPDRRTVFDVDEPTDLTR
ncbi:MAG TPA: molybdenum cofactor guanylyltransferase [Actinomycetota bacterium]|nr:molybdenum cofactor guanylyltransferase [Actinomycetota bacterium]